LAWVADYISRQYACYMVSSTSLAQYYMYCQYSNILLVTVGDFNSYVFCIDLYMLVTIQFVIYSLVEFFFFLLVIYFCSLCSIKCSEILWFGDSVDNTVEVNCRVLSLI